MKILWITNILLPEANSLLSGNKELRSTGGWMIGAANALRQHDGIALFIASTSTLVKDLQKVAGRNITFYALPLGKGNMHVNRDYDQFWKHIVDDIKPDIVHIHGTEYSHGHSFVKTFPNMNTIISIQGLTSVCARYHNYGLSTWDILNNITLRDLIKGNLFIEKRKFEKRGEYEIDMLKTVKHIIGRTSWDKAHVWAINPTAEYHFCNETLRDGFYNGDTWSYENCHKHTIFASQATYPIKGFHQILKAMPIILKHYPDARIRVAGMNMTQQPWKGYTGYGKYLKKLIEKLDLTDKVEFLGNLNESEMKHEYLTANVFVSPSSIENSPNSVGEAQILGTPCVSSYVGGVCDMMSEDSQNVYRFEETEMLAFKIVRIFNLAGNVPNVIEVAKERHCPSVNSSQLLSIYNQMLNK